jgi:hypothetical protein
LLHGHVIAYADVDAVEPPPASEYLLGGVDVHHSEVAAECPAEASGPHDAADDEFLLSVNGEKREAAADL